MVARANKVSVEEYKPEKKPSCLHINLEKNPMPQSHLKLGAKMTLIIEGKVTSVSQNEYGKDLSLDVISLKHKSTEEESEEDDD